MYWTLLNHEKPLSEKVWHPTPPLSIGISRPLCRLASQHPRLAAPFLPGTFGNGVGDPRVNVYKKRWKDPPFRTGRPTISMAIFYSYVKLPEGRHGFHLERVWKSDDNPWQCVHISPRSSRTCTSIHGLQEKFLPQSVRLVEGLLWDTQWLTIPWGQMGPAQE